jgi:MFS family permease
MEVSALDSNSLLPSLTTPVIYYTPIIFRSLGLTNSTTSLLATGITGVLNVLTTIPAVLVIDRVGRKPLLYCGSIGMMTTMIILAILVSQFQHDWVTHAAAGWGCVVMIWLYIINFAYSWGPVSWTLIAEVFSLSIRAKGTSIGASTQWMLSFVIALVTPRMLESISWGMYVFFAGWLAAGMVFVYFFVPETKGKTLEEMDQVFGYVADFILDMVILLTCAQVKIEHRGLGRAGCCAGRGRPAQGHERDERVGRRQREDFCAGAGLSFGIVFSHLGQCIIGLSCRPSLLQKRFRFLYI